MATVKVLESRIPKPLSCRDKLHIPYQYSNQPRYNPMQHQDTIEQRVLNETLEAATECLQLFIDLDEDRNNKCPQLKGATKSSTKAIRALERGNCPFLRSVLLLYTARNLY